MPFHRIAKTIGIILALQCTCTVIVHAATPPPYRGVNFSGAEFGGCTKPAKYGYQYVYPAPKIIDYFVGLGMNTFRLPFCWERLQPAANSAFDAAELERLNTAVRYATDKGAYVILDPHNYGSYRGEKLGTDTTNAAFADFWKKLAAQFKDNDRVIFGLMNEPHGMSAETWLTAANAAIAAIRVQDAANLILIPGTSWSGAHSWITSGNAAALLKIEDSANHHAFEMHQYLDSDSSGTHAECVDEGAGVRRLAAATAWLKQHNKQGFLGEFGGGKNTTCFNAVANMLDNLTQNSDVWIGWTYWSAGAWLGNYMFALPLAPTDQPSQLDVLKKFLTSAPPSPPSRLQPQAR